ncbi:MAG: hypothetical protein JXQ81_11545 [Desulfuromonadales bacterium]|nr:hypothetical protein [Desulfuromonadales bacterium]MBN2793133.1 hypothetical protein [Desulfuromonadales bacterium]
MDSVSIAGVSYDSAGKPELRFVDRETFSSDDDCRVVLETLVRRHQLHKGHCSHVLSSNMYQLVQTDMADLPAAERREAARWQIRERIDYPPEEAVLDLFEVAPFSGDKKPLVYVVSAQKTILQERVNLLKVCGLNVDVIDIPEFSLRNICDLFTEDVRGCAIFLLLENSGLLVVSRGGTLYLVRLFSAGMNDLIPFADGDYESLTDRLDGIVLEIQRSFDYCESTFHLPMVSRLLVAQTIREIPAVISYLNEYLVTQVETFSFDGVMTLPEGLDPLQVNRNLLAIGAALRQEGH